MSQPVKLSDALILDARLIAKAAERSIAGQIEYWARLGRAIEPLIAGETALSLRRKGDEVPLSIQIQNVDSAEGKKQLTAYLDCQPFPHFEAAPDLPGYLVRIDEDGTRTVGRFVQRQFIPIATSRPIAKESNSAAMGQRDPIKRPAKKAAKKTAKKSAKKPRRS